MTSKTKIELMKVAHWDKAYEHKKTDQLSWFQSEPALSLKLIANAKLRPEAHILDAGGGASKLVDALLDLKYQNITVVDIAETAISASRKRLAAKALKVNWIVGDLLNWYPSNPIDLWHDRAVFHFLITQKERQSYIDLLNKGVSHHGQVIIATFALDGPEKCSGLPVCRYDERTLSKELGEEFELMETTHEEHLTPAGNSQYFIYCRFKKH